MADLGQNVSLPCPGGGSGSDAVWVRDGRALSDAAPAADGHLLVTDASVDDEGLYGCLQHDGSDSGDVRYVKLLVKRESTPHRDTGLRHETGTRSRDSTLGTGICDIGTGPDRTGTRGPGYEDRDTRTEHGRHKGTV